MMDEAQLERALARKKKQEAVARSVAHPMTATAA